MAAEVFKNGHRVSDYLMLPTGALLLRNAPVIVIPLKAIADCFYQD
jgi:hypothetical protein